MVPYQSKASVGLEYFCFQGDDLWEMDDDALVELLRGRLEGLGPVRSATNGTVSGFSPAAPIPAWRRLAVGPAPRSARHAHVVSCWWCADRS